LAEREDPRRRGLNDAEQQIRPGTLTRVAPLARDPERVSLHIDGRFALVLPALVALQRGLREGVVLDDAAVAELAELAEMEKAVTAALHFVGYRPRSEREVRDRLRRRGFGPPAIDAAIERLRGWRYLDDQAFAEYWVENRVEHAPRGKRRLASELRAKGVDREVVGATLEQAELNEPDAALALARKRLASLSGLDEATQRRRLSGFLARRGYDWDVVRGTLASLYGTDEGNPDSP
jgi:regulatory protein